MRTVVLNACAEASAHEWISRTAKCEGEGTERRGSWNGEEEGEAEKGRGKADGRDRGPGGVAGGNYEDLARPGPSGRMPIATYLLRSP